MLLLKWKTISISLLASKDATAWKQYHTPLNARAIRREREFGNLTKEDTKKHHLENQAKKIEKFRATKQV